MDLIKPINIGIYGCGAIAKAHARELLKIPGVRLRAYCDIVIQKAECFLQEYGGEYATADAGKLTDDDEIDAIYVSTMHNNRLQILKLAAEAGKAVFMEKPLTHNQESLTEMGRILKKNPVLFQSGYKIRFHSMVEKARTLLTSPDMIVAHVFDEIWPENHLNSLEVGGGNIRAQGVYATEILHILAGSNPVSVTAMSACRRHASRIEDTLGAVYKFENGAIGVVAVADAGSGTDAVSKFFAEAVGGNRTLTLLNRYKRLEWHDQITNQNIVFEGEEDGFYKQSVSFIDSVRNGVPTQCDYIQGAIPSIMIYRALESAGKGRTVEIDIPK